MNGKVVIVGTANVISLALDEALLDAVEVALGRFMRVRWSLG